MRYLVFCLVFLFVSCGDPPPEYLYEIEVYRSNVLNIAPKYEETVVARTKPKRIEGSLGGVGARWIFYDEDGGAREYPGNYKFKVKTLETITHLDPRHSLYGE